MRPIPLAPLLLLAACSWRPAHYADVPAVTEVADDARAARPRQTELPELVYFSEAYLRRPAVDALDPERVSEAGDVSSLDEVPRSSWHRPVPLDARGFERAWRVDGPPKPPFVPIGGRTQALGSGLRAKDARGLVWELGRDARAFPEARTAAAVVSARLLRALGYLVPETYIVELDGDDFAGAPELVGPFLAEGPPARRGQWRAVAVRWPIGVDVGTTPIAEARGDDPNDRVEHRDRRTLRVLGIVGAWLRLDIGPSVTRDVWLEAPARQHVIHELVRLDGTLGATRWEPSRATESAAGDVHGSMLGNLVTLGLRADPPDPVPEGPQPLAHLEPTLAEDAFEPRRPYEPAARCLDADAYWIAKRMMSLPRDLVKHAVRSASLSDPQWRSALVGAIEARSRVVAERIFARVTPLELELVQGGVIVLRDEAVRRGLASAKTTRLRVEIFDSNAKPIGAPLDVRPTGARVRLPIAALPQGYNVVRIVAERDGTAAPRAFEAHVVRDGRGTRVVGIRH